ncbi:hypothetical protein [Halioxenophilus aromaticivorans]|uniref:Uncharacterized protein n=1 Tax=Halioxenophilus aromaticivorans TaxID=1306992 RepID=A0AAV3U4T5_9ALTE
MQNRKEGISAVDNGNGPSGENLSGQREEAPTGGNGSLSEPASSFGTVLKAVKSPLSVFGLAMLICNAVFSLAAAMMDSLDAFIYSIHTFLAIVFAFIIIALWSPRSLYHPREMDGLEAQVPEVKHSRLIVTGLIVFGGCVYTAYQVFKVIYLGR